MWVNGWRVELTLTTCSHSKMFNHTIPLQIQFPCKTFPVRAVEAQVEELDIAKLV
jgi:hypothetical protein